MNNLSASLNALYTWLCELLLYGPLLIDHLQKPTCAATHVYIFSISFAGTHLYKCLQNPYHFLWDFVLISEYSLLICQATTYTYQNEKIQVWQVIS